MFKRPTPTQRDSEASGKSVYFDAPLMHFFSKRKSTVDPDQPVEGDKAVADVQRNPSVAIGAISSDPTVDEEMEAPLVGDGMTANGIHEKSDEAEQPTVDNNNKPNVLTKPAPAAAALTTTTSDEKPGTSTKTPEKLHVLSKAAPAVAVAAIAREDSAGPSEAPAYESNGHPPVSDTKTLLDKEDSAPSDVKMPQPDTVPPPLPPRSASPISTTFAPPPSSLSGNGMADGGSTFIDGAGTTGPNSVPVIDDSVHVRAASADASLTPKQRSKILKEEKKEGKRLSKIIQQEAKAEKAALAVAMKELSALQSVQKTAVKRESTAHSIHAKLMPKTAKLEAALSNATAAHSKSAAELQARADELEKSRAAAKETTEKVAEKMREVERLRTLKGVDDRERVVKVRELSQG